MKNKKFLVAFIIVSTVMLSSFAFYAYQIVFTPNILVDQSDQYFTIPTGSTFKDVQNKIKKEGVVNDLLSFSFLSKLKKYHENIKPGMYLLKKDMSNKDAINLLRSGAQTPVKISFTGGRKLEDVPERLAKNVEFSDEKMKALLMHDTTATYYGFKPNTFISMFIPDTYEVYWNTSARAVLDRMKKEYDRFWTKKRLAKAKKLNMTREEVSTLASIVQGETNKPDEAPTVAGVYLNRLKKGMKLEADPTLVFANNDFNIRRVLYKHKEIDSPYNTYKYKGLPPGPIMMPRKPYLDAVLNYKPHDYIFFCAKEDFSGYHSFAKTYREHLKNAKKFQKAMNQRKIYR